MKIVALVLFLALPAPDAPAPPKPLDQLVADLLDIRRQKSDLGKREAETAAAPKAQLKSLTEQLQKLGLLDPVPVPPVPVPPVPAPPADPLREKIAAAFTSAAGDAGQKREWAKDLAALYRQGAKLAQDPAVTGARGLKDKLAAAAGVLVGPDALREVRQLVAGELALVLPTADADLTDPQRKAAADLFGRLAVILDGM